MLPASFDDRGVRRIYRNRWHKRLIGCQCRSHKIATTSLSRNLSGKSSRLLTKSNLEKMSRLTFVKTNDPFSSAYTLFLESKNGRRSPFTPARWVQLYTERSPSSKSVLQDLHKKTHQGQYSWDSTVFVDEISHIALERSSTSIQQCISCPKTDSQAQLSFIGRANA